jgi:hypothetical protein
MPMAGAHGRQRRGQSSLRQVNGREPDIRYDIPNRTALGAFLVDEEPVTGFPKPDSPAELRAVLIYRFSGELIHQITILT